MRVAAVLIFDKFLSAGQTAANNCKTAFSLHVIESTSDDYRLLLLLFIEKLIGKLVQNKYVSVQILLCDRCDAGYHTACLRPPIMVIPEDDWFCPLCEHVSSAKES